MPGQTIDRAWGRIEGLRCIAFVYRPQDQHPHPPGWRAPLPGTSNHGHVQHPLPGEITGIEGDSLYVVLDGEEEPRKVYWWNVRPR